MTAELTPTHRVAVVAARMRELAGSVAEASVWSMGPVEAHETLVELTRLEAQVASLKLKVAAHVVEVDEGDAVAAWAHTTVQSPRAARVQAKLARSLEAYPAVQSALATGRIDVDQARVICRALEVLPADLGRVLVAKAEAFLLDAAREHHASALRVLGRRLFEVIAPEEADAREAAALEREERADAATARFTSWTDGRGRLHGRFVLPPLAGTMLLTALTAIAKRQHPTQRPDSPDPDAPPPARFGAEALGRALVTLVETYPREALRRVGGANATVVITLSYEALVGQLKEAGVVLDPGQRISPGEARRLACTAGIIPAVLGTRGEVLDLGRSTRLFSPAQKTAIAVRDGGTCTHPGCDQTTGFTDVHHDLAWSAGGRTDLTNGRLLCRRHHRQHHRTHPPDGSRTRPGYHPRT